MKKWLKALVAVAAVGMLATLGACGASKSSSTSGPQKVTFWGSWSGSQVKQLNQLIGEYNKSQNKYKVSYKVQDEVEKKLLTGIAGGEVPDVIMWDRVQTSVYAKKNALLDMSSLVKKDDVKMSQFYPETVNEMKVDGKQYGIPLLVDTRAIFYNKKLLAAAGVQPPKTWSELEEAAKKTTKWENGKLVQAGFSLNDVGLYNMWIAQAGGQMLNNAETKTAFNSAAGKSVLTYWNKLLNQDKVYQVGFNDGSDQFAAGKVAMVYSGPWAEADYDKVKDLDYGVVQPAVGPNGDKGAMTGGFGLVIPKTAKNQKGAWDFIKWWTTNPKIGVKFAKISGWLPANMKAANNDYFTTNPKYAAFVKTMDYAKTRPTVTGYADVEGLALTPQLQNFVSGKVSADKALSNAQKQGDKILKEAKDK